MINEKNRIHEKEVSQTMTKKFLSLTIILSLAAFTSMAVIAAETESPARAAARKKAEEKMKKEGSSDLSTTGSKLIDLNRASKQQLMTLPGIGEAEADSIIAARPYQTKTQLRKKEILPTATFYGIVEKVEIKLEKKTVQKPVAKPAPAPASREEEPKRDIFKEYGK